MIRIGIAGAGGIGRKHLEALSAVDGAEIAAVVDPDGEAARKAAGPGVPVFGDLAECLPLVDAVWICTPPSSHRELAVAALGRGSRGVVGTKGTAALEGPDVWSLSGLRWKTKDMAYEAAEIFTDVLDTESYRAADADFLSSLTTGGSSVPLGRDGAAALAVSLALLESSRTGRSVRSKITTEMPA